MYHILLVDDEKNERDGMKFLIEKYKLPMTVAEAQNGKVALEYVKSHHVDILFTDVKMPFMDGLELAKEVNEYDSNVVIIIFSAYSEFEYAQKACDANAVNYLLKPIELDEFEAVMKKAMDRCAEHEQQMTERRALLGADKKLLLYRMVSAKEFDTGMMERLRNYNIDLSGKYMLFISIETKNNYFETQEEAFEGILPKYMNIHYEKINLYPNLTYLFLYYARIDDGEIEKMVKRIYLDMTRLSEERISIIVGDKFTGTELIGEKLEQLEELREDTFSYFAGIIYSSELGVDSHSKTEEALQIRDSIMRCLEDKNLPAMREQLDIYFNRLERDRAISAFYTKYILLDIVKALYMTFDIYNENVVFTTTDKIMKSANLEEIRQVLADALAEAEKISANIGESDGSAVAKVKKMIGNEYAKDLSLDDLAERVGLTPAYLSYIFKQETGNNLVKYLTCYRMEKAKAMLEKGDRKIIDVGKACGYMNQPYFNRLFKNMYGVTPKQYKENVGKGMGDSE
ncbi:MAG: response regulator [Lachnospiraceae bacterium]|nr:response regulator [Lachnospiraceae bacterium]